MRWVVIGLATACALVVGAFGYRTAATTRDDPEAWRQSELAFLKSVPGSAVVSMKMRRRELARFWVEEDEHVGGITS